AADAVARQGVHQPEQCRRVARRASRLPGGLPQAGRARGAVLLFAPLVRHGDLCLAADGSGKVGRDGCALWRPRPRQRQHKGEAARRKTPRPILALRTRARTLCCSVRHAPAPRRHRGGLRLTRPI
ncbi:hypothetical protein EMIHUDRAFT_444953, partial [Emiliania huxleyi CCMP1516]|uniref:Uncharacterized protein n=2 Tax=Emiliania huxleyi TaxID=2903 RepID=A0A0D3J6X6_EMIH1